MKVLKNILRFSLPLTFGILIFMWVYRKMDFGQIWVILEEGVAYRWLALSIVLGILSHVLRAARWRLLVRLLGVNPSLNTLTNAVFINYGANLILPRLGEVWRCVYIAKKEKTTFTKVFGTMLSERLVDVLLMVILIVIGMFTMMDVFSSFFKENIQFKIPYTWVLFSPYLYLGIALMMGFLFFVYHKSKHLSLFLKIKLLLHELWIGLKTLIVLPHKGLFTVLSLLIWFCYLMQLYVCFFAFHFTQDLGLAIGFSMFIMGSIAFSLPVQGGIGPWHFMIISTMVFYGVGQTEAAAFALIVHTLQTLENAMVGVYAFFVTGTSNLKNENI